jgi:hypothetical protein
MATKYTIKGELSVEFEITLDAEDEDDVRAAVHDKLAASVKLLDLDHEVYEECISELDYTITAET